MACAHVNTTTPHESQLLVGKGTPHALTAGAPAMMVCERTRVHPMPHDVVIVYDGYGLGISAGGIVEEEVVDEKETCRTRTQLGTD
eukprot:SAG31_NODE_3097_length_4679_cov_2.040175_2_plen_86_part_00